MSPNSEVQIHSPNYPNAPPINSESIWQFEAPQGFVINYNITIFSNENNFDLTNNNKL